MRDIKSKSNYTSLRYPKDRRIESDVDYLRLQIAKYAAPFQLGSNSPLSGLVTGVNKIETKDDKGNVTNTSLDIKFGTSGLREVAKRTGTRSNRESLKKPLGQIVLPIPQQLSDISAIDWTDGKLNPIEAYGLAATGSIINSFGQEGIGGGFDTVKQIFGQIGKDAAAAAKNTQIQNAVLAAISGAAIGNLGGNVTANQLVSRATGQVFQPNLELLFNGVNLRVFPFTFEFFPRNRDEGEEVKKIIRLLKKSMLPSKGGAEGVFISAPHIFQLTYMKGDGSHPFLNRFLPMALTNMSVNYTGSNTYSTFYDGTPTHIKVEVLFKELNPIYREDYDELGEDYSVGY
tara:strand:+ start:461 stop:1495 length:1035 start_codon:yes stop_codon:yes gene_type:complete